MAIDPVTSHRVQLEALKKLINNPPANECPVLCGITPGLARAILDDKTITPDRQRKISTAKHKQYTSDMVEKRWSLLGDCLKFSHKLEDGQHRLKSCADSGEVLKVHVMFGLDPDLFYRMDQGKVRDKKDVFTIEGIPYASITAGAVRWVKILIEGKNRGTAYTPGELLNFYRTDLANKTGFSQCVSLAVKAKKTAKKEGIAPAHAAGIAYKAILDGAKTNRVLQFISQLGELTAPPRCAASVCRSVLKQLKDERSGRLHEDIRGYCLAQCLAAHLGGPPIYQKDLLAWFNNPAGA